MTLRVRSWTAPLRVKLIMSNVCSHTQLRAWGRKRSLNREESPDARQEGRVHRLRQGGRVEQEPAQGPVPEHEVAIRIRGHECQGAVRLCLEGPNPSSHQAK